MSYKDAFYFAKLMSLEERRRQTTKKMFIKMQEARKFYMIYSHHYNVLSLDILIRVNLFALTQTDLKTLLFIILRTIFNRAVKNILGILCHSNS